MTAVSNFRVITDIRTKKIIIKKLKNLLKFFADYPIYITGKVIDTRLFIRTLAPVDVYGLILWRRKQ